MISVRDSLIQLHEQQDLSLNAIVPNFFKQHTFKLLGLSILGYVSYKIWKRPRNLPPGPINWPIQTAIEQPDSWHIDFVRLGRQYGDVFSFYYGSRLIVVLNSHDAIRECFQKRKDFCERVPPAFNYFLNFDDEISGQRYSDKWKENKKFAVQALRKSGFGAPSSEQKVQAQIDELLLYVRELGGEAVDLLEPLRFTTANVIASVLVSASYPWGHPDQIQLIEGTEQLLATFGDCHFVNQLAAWLPYWAIKVFFPSTVRTLAGGIGKLADYIHKRIHEHRQTFDPDNPRDFLDIYIKHRSQEEDFSDHRFVCTTMAFMPDAIDTTAFVVLWSLLFLGHFPDEQEKATRQIQSVCKGGRPPCLNDRSSLTCVEAIILETMRIVNIFPTTTAHSALEDTTFRGFHIPKSADVFANLYGVHLDPNVFEEPTEFRPSRFLDEHQNLANTESVIPFGVGRRMCMGEQLVRIELFLILSSLLHQFTFAFPPNQEKPALDANRNVISSPQRFLISAKSHA